MIRVIILAVALAALIPATAQARRGGSDFMNSPGYQRALAESRKKYREQYRAQRLYEEQQRARRVKRPRHH